MMKINHIRLRSETDSQMYGADLELSGGLNVIQADNTSGKSTTVQSILYCLGMEGALGPNKQVPLPYAMREKIELTPDSEYELVNRSYVALEIQNSLGNIITIRRDIRGGSDKKLIRLWNRSVASVFEADRSDRDFFLADAGAAVREDGFHHYLAKFIGWDLPSVPRFDGAEGILYLEAIFPLFFVEQKRGWSTTVGPLPTYLGIQDISRRAIEFVLDLDAGKIRRRRAELRRELASVESRFSNRRDDLLDDAGKLVRIGGIPKKPSEDFAAEAAGYLTVFHNGEWVDFQKVASLIEQEIASLDDIDETTVGAELDKLRANLRASEKRYAELSGNIALLRQDFDLAIEEKNSFLARVQALEIDLKRNQDAKKLEELGSTLGVQASTGSCPTCHQGVTSELLPLVSVETMGLDENIAFAKAQLELYRSSLGYAIDNIDYLKVSFESQNNDLEEVRKSIRSLKQDLLRPSSSPARAQLEEAARKKALLDRWYDIQERVDSQIEALRNIAMEAVGLKRELSGLGAGGLSYEDKAKIQFLTDCVQSLLTKFGFSSFKPSEIGLSEDDFRPQVLTKIDDDHLQLRDIGFEASASDGIRLKWAYYLSILQLAQRFDLNHWGFLVFDEPGQQQMKEVDLHSMLSWASQSVRDDFQVIVTTSEKREQVRDAIADAKVTLHEVDGFILKPIR
ncbi:hypothetical protein AAG614_10410 [Citromicrobium bathyomarinum]